ncbi:hypothetical protein NXS19_003750 [Fusarium pseudograminearum]|nr:hypothetical protein NXS19_003750 [Fusarium pseudograminearum]
MHLPQNNEGIRICGRSLLLPTGSSCIEVDSRRNLWVRQSLANQDTARQSRGLGQTLTDTVHDKHKLTHCSSYSVSVSMRDATAIQCAMITSHAIFAVTG